MANKRIFYACQRAGISPAYSAAPPTFQTIRGLQSVGCTTTFRLDQVFEIGQLAIYENIEGIPDIEVTTEKVMDGYCPVYVLATQCDQDGNAPTAATLSGRSKGVCILGIAIYAEELAQGGHEGVAEGDVGTEVHMSGLYVSSVRYQANVDRNVTESVTLVGNNKVWTLGGDTGNFKGVAYVGGGTWDEPWTNPSVGGLEPLAIDGSGGVQGREDIVFGSGTNGSGWFSILPVNVPGVTRMAAGSITGINVMTAADHAHLQSWSIRCDLGREQLFELGKRANYSRYINWPVEVINEIAVIAQSGDLISATEEGIYGTTGVCGGLYNLTENYIRLCLCEGLVVDCGQNNKLRTVGVTGGDTGRGNVEVTYTYSNFNEMAVSHPQDPVVAIRP